MTIYANNGFKPGKAWKTPGGKDFKVELVLVDDPVAMRDAYAAGTLHIGWATLDMLRPGVQFPGFQGDECPQTAD